MRRRCRKKNALETGGHKKLFTEGGGSKFQRGLEIFQKAEGLTKKGEKIQGRLVVTLHNMNFYVSTLRVNITQITRK